MVLVNIYGMSLNSLGFILFLKLSNQKSNEYPKNLFPLFLGTIEINLIANIIYNQKLERPSTHKLILNFIEKAKYTIEKVCINKFIDKTLYANIFLRSADSNSIMKIDARPSDAIAIALNYKSSIYIKKSIFEKLSLPFSELQAEPNIDIDIFEKNKKKSSVDFPQKIEIPLDIPISNSNRAEKIIADNVILSSVTNQKDYLKTKKEVLQKMIDTAIDEEKYERAAALKIGLDNI